MTPDQALAAALRRVGIPARVTDLEKSRFPQHRARYSSVGKTIAVSRNTWPMEMPVARALPGADRTIRVGSRETVPQGTFSCTVIRKQLVASVRDGKDKELASLACLPPKKYLRDGAEIPVWWFSAYEELGGGSPWHDGFDDNGTYFWTVDGMCRRGRGDKVLVMGFSRDGSRDFGDHPLKPKLRHLIDESWILEQDFLTLYWNVLPCVGGKSPVVALIFGLGTPEDLRVLPPMFVRARSIFSQSPDVQVVWKLAQEKRILLF